MDVHTLGSKLASKCGARLTSTLEEEVDVASKCEVVDVDTLGSKFVVASKCVVVDVH